MIHYAEERWSQWSAYHVGLDAFVGFLNICKCEHKLKILLVRLSSNHQHAELFGQKCKGQTSCKTEYVRGSNGEDRLFHRLCRGLCIHSLFLHVRLP